MTSVSVLPPDPARTSAAAAAPHRDSSAIPGFSRPIQVPFPPTALARIAAIVPCHNRRADAEALLSDLATLDTTGIDLRIILVDNASTIPLADLNPPGLAIDHLRLNANTGGSGGYSAGLALALSLDDRSTEQTWRDFDPEFVWLVDSDARVPADTLRSLLASLRADPHAIAAGPAIADPATGIPFELGGYVNRRNGTFEPYVPGAAGVSHVGCGTCDVRCKNQNSSASTSHVPHPASHISVEYLAACCALVRADAARAAGRFPDAFLNGDDVEWFIRMARRTGGHLLGLPSCIACHPRFDRFPTWTRYYTTRNAFGPIDAAGAPRSARFRRAMLDVFRAAQQRMMGRDDLARLHMLGLKHAAAGRTTGPAPAGTIVVDPATPLAQASEVLRQRGALRPGATVAAHPNPGLPAHERDRLLDALRADIDPKHPIRTLNPRSGPRGLLGALGRALGFGRADIALVPARGRPECWFAGRTLIEVAPGSCVIRAPHRLAAPLGALSAIAIGTLRAARIALGRRTALTTLDPSARAAAAIARGTGRTMSVEAIVLSHNRWPALEATIDKLLASPAFDGRASDPGVARTITVVDNNSTDGTRDRAEAFLVPRGINLIALHDNRGVEAFNAAVARSTADAVLILDDDATPDDHALVVAIDDLASRQSLAAVTLHPIHPKGGRSEWPFHRAVPHGTDRWPFMGCANLVRRTDWTRVGGFEPSFFLYRNDADLALKLLAAGRGVRFHPALVAWHDSPAGPGARKSVRWHEMATRNWIWMARRHAASSLPLPLGGLLGYIWAHKLAGLSIERHLATFRGLRAGIGAGLPTLSDLRPGGGPWRSLLRLHLGRSEK